MDLAADFVSPPELDGPMVGLVMVFVARVVAGLAAKPPVCFLTEAGSTTSCLGSMQGPLDA